MSIPTHYTVTQNGDLIESILDSDGNSVPIDPRSVEYGRFATWANRQKTRVARSYEPMDWKGEFFCSMKDVIDFCKLKCIYLDGISEASILRHQLNNNVVRTHATSIRSISFLAVYKSSPAWDITPLDDRQPAFFVSETLYEELFDAARTPGSDAGKLFAIPVEKTFVYVDVSEFSRHEPEDQLIVISTLIRLVNDPAWWSEGNSAQANSGREASICIGDGYIFVFSDPSHATFFAACLAVIIENLVNRKSIIDFHFRISVHTGPVYQFWDRGSTPNDGRWNYVGQGIIEGERVLSAIGKDQDDVVFMSAETRAAIMKKSSLNWIDEAVKHSQNRGRRADKHGNFRRLYEINHTAWMSHLTGGTWTMDHP